ncbi:alkaline phosphatase family protein [Spiractinospora alimapuensis]|uniref:alkaline phosphatase family protein n=1 Tax=Spiractinospora alimapuensis TaxID=2820884 RepID=UPI0022AB2635|nr:nucleotide pyrophosphatase/phosphodiesterase family protein [Spiractinospora alimapuensis]QVQ52410.1 alkaline phosphatase family protein [Spiractinospora alimapuensis]
MSDHGTTPLVVIDVVGLTPRLLRHMPRLSALAAAGFQAELEPTVPAVTCSMQSTLLTGTPPRDHGSVANGWYFRELGEVHLWRQHNRLVGGEKVWETARRALGGDPRGGDDTYTVANVCWWYAMGASADWTITPRPIYYADGKKEPDCYTYPPALHEELTAELGGFPLFNYWGPTAGLASTEWLVGAARALLRDKRPDLTLVYLPHLDYDLQRYGPDDPRAARAAADLDQAMAPLLMAAKERGATTVALSEYGITPARRPVDVNRALRHAGLLEVYSQDEMEYLDPWTSRAFAVADHQIAHVYVREPEDLARAREVLERLDGVDQVLDRRDQAEIGLDHARSGELVVLAEREAWFTYYYWLDDHYAPDFAKLVEIHRKPGFDPAELFMDPDDPLVKVRAATALARKKSGMRYTMNVIPLNGRQVRGTHGLTPPDPENGPVLLSDAPDAAVPRIHATDVKELLLRLAGADVSSARKSERL